MGYHACDSCLSDLGTTMALWLFRSDIQSGGLCLEEARIMLEGYGF